jgi:hypothetical protein
MMMNELEKAFERYKKKFDDDFPTIPFDSRKDEEIIDIIDECIEANKDVYDIGYLSLDDIMY